MPPLLYSCSIKPRPKGVKSMPSFQFMDINGNTKEIDINKLNSVEDVAAEHKKFCEETKKGKKVYISTKEDKLASLKVYEPKVQEETN